MRAINLPFTALGGIRLRPTIRIPRVSNSSMELTSDSIKYEVSSRQRLLQDGFHLIPKPTKMTFSVYTTSMHNNNNIEINDIVTIFFSYEGTLTSYDTNLKISEIKLISRRGYRDKLEIVAHGSLKDIIDKDLLPFTNDISNSPARTVDLTEIRPDLNSFGFNRGDRITNLDYINERINTARDYLAYLYQVSANKRNSRAFTLDEVNSDLDKQIAGVRLTESNLTDISIEQNHYNKAGITGKYDYDAEEFLRADSILVDIDEENLDIQQNTITLHQPNNVYRNFNDINVPENHTILSLADRADVTFDWNSVVFTITYITGRSQGNPDGNTTTITRTGNIRGLRRNRAIRVENIGDSYSRIYNNNTSVGLRITDDSPSSVISTNSDVRNDVVDELNAGTAEYTLDPTIPAFEIPDEAQDITVTEIQGTQSSLIFNVQIIFTYSSINTRLLSGDPIIRNFFMRRNPADYVVSGLVLGIDNIETQYTTLTAPTFLGMIQLVRRIFDEIPSELSDEIIDTKEVNLTYIDTRLETGDVVTLHKPTGRVGLLIDGYSYDIKGGRTPSQTMKISGREVAIPTIKTDYGQALVDGTLLPSSERLNVPNEICIVDEFILVAQGDNSIYRYRLQTGNRTTRYIRGTNFLNIQCDDNYIYAVDRIGSGGITNRLRVFNRSTLAQVGSNVDWSNAQQLFVRNGVIYGGRGPSQNVYITSGTPGSLTAMIHPISYPSDWNIRVVQNVAVSPTGRLYLQVRGHSSPFVAGILVWNSVSSFINGNQPNSRIGNNGIGTGNNQFGNGVLINDLDFYDGNLYVMDTDNDRIQVFRESDGAYIRTISFSDLSIDGETADTTTFNRINIFEDTLYVSGHRNNLANSIITNSGFVRRIQNIL